MGKPKFGGNGRPQGNPWEALIGEVRRSPDGTMLAILLPSPPSEYRWSCADNKGSLGHERDERIAHWPVIGAVPGTPAAGMELVPTR